MKRIKYILIILGLLCLSGYIIIIVLEDCLKNVFCFQEYSQYFEVYPKANLIVSVKEMKLIYFKKSKYTVTSVNILNIKIN